MKTSISGFVYVTHLAFYPDPLGLMLHYLVINVSWLRSLVTFADMISEETTEEAKQIREDQP